MIYDEQLGHWLGLYHVFQNTIFEENADPCDPANQNDYVDDTPTMQDNTKALFPKIPCRALTDIDTCPDLPGVDPVYNVMNYINDRSCLPDFAEFTCGQLERMYKQWLLYRDTVDNGCENDGEFEIEIFIVFDKVVHTFHNSFYLLNPAGETILNSTTDHNDFEVENAQDTLLVDLCGEWGCGFCAHNVSISACRESIECSNKQLIHFHV